MVLTGVQNNKDSNTPCICCGGMKWVVHTRLPRVLFKTNSKILKCNACGCGMSYPKPKTLFNYYEENRHYVQQFSGKEQKYRAFADDLLSNLDGVADSYASTLLDVGCGGAFLVQMAKARGFIAQGIEANAELVKWAQTRGLDVEQGDVCKLKEQGRSYDVIVLSAVLEHLEDPRLLLDTCKDLLSKEGMILISQASYDGFLPTLFPWGWYGWQPHEHYWHFTPDSFETLTTNAGFQTVQVVRKSLYHPWFATGSPKVVVGRNLAAILARIGVYIGEGDSFHAIIKKRNN